MTNPNSAPKGSPDPAGAQWYKWGQCASNTQRGDYLRREVSEMTKDPVCGMMVDLETTSAKAEYKGQTHYFCCPGCKAAFEKDPEKYLKAAAVAKGHHHGH